MSILSCELAISGRRGKRSLTSPREYSQTWLVKTDNTQDGSEKVLAHPGLPRLGSLYNYGNDRDVSAVCMDVEAVQDDANPKFWRVDVEFSSGPGGQQEEQQQIDLSPHVSWSSAQFQRVVWRDSRGKALMSSAAEFFDPPVQVDDSRPVLHVEINRLAFNPVAIQRYVNAINSDSWYGMPPYTVRCMSINATEQESEQGQQFFACSFDFQFNFDGPPNKVSPPDNSGGWILYLLDQGTVEVLPADNSKARQRQRMTDAQGQYVSAPEMLNGQGQRLVRATDKFDPNRHTPVFIPFHVYRELPFGQLLQL